MDDSPKKEGYPLLPEQSVKCIWMTAGFISYKLCKYDLQCEKCPLDWELRNLSPTPSCDSDGPPKEVHLRTGEAGPPPLSEKGLKRRRQERSFNVALLKMYPGKQMADMNMKDGEIAIKHIKPFIGP